MTKKYENKYFFGHDQFMIQNHKRSSSKIEPLHMILGLDVMKIIGSHCDLKTLLNLKLTCKELYESLEVSVSNTQNLLFSIIVAYTKDPYNRVVAICTSDDHVKRCLDSITYITKTISGVRLEECEISDKDSKITNFNSILYYETSMSCKITYNETMKLSSWNAESSWTRVKLNSVFEHMKNVKAYHLPYCGPN